MAQAGKVVYYYYIFKGKYGLPGVLYTYIYAAVIPILPYIL